jgi:hypothetical protein
MSSISTISSSNAYLLDQQGGIGQDLQALQKALNSGDLSAAQKAFATFQQSLQSVGQGPTESQTSQTNLQNDLQGIKEALDSGDLAGAKKAFSSLRQDLQKVRHGGHHHHHTKSAQSDVNPSNNSTVGNSTNSGNNLSVLAQESTALLNDGSDDSADTAVSVDLTA